MQGPQVSYLPDGRRLHLHHGPIDLIVEAHGPGRGAALRAAADRFQTILEELVSELDLLRRPVGAHGVSKRLGVPLRGGFALRLPVARKMAEAVLPFAPRFITPMAAVAGAVADEILRVMVASGDLRRAYVNNGGDVALHLGQGETFTAAIVGAAGGRARIGHETPVRGVATSGWRGRSYSLGIADTVTVLARNAARADAAATMIANAVDLPGNPKVRRCAARDMSPDSDLGALPVTVGVDPLTAGEIGAALDRGEAFAVGCLRRGLIEGALLGLGGDARVVGAGAMIEFETREPCNA